MIKDYYDILGVTPLATPMDICRAYKNLALQWHPERASGDKLAAYKIFCDISEAFDVLYDQEKKALFDKFGYLKLKNGLSSADGIVLPGYQFLGNCEEIFESFFGTNNYYSALLQCPGEYEKYVSQKFKITREGPKDIVQVIKLGVLDIYAGNTFTVEFVKTVINDDGITTREIQTARLLKKKSRCCAGIRSRCVHNFKRRRQSVAGLRKLSAH